MTSYTHAIEYIKENKDTDSAIGLAKLILSLGDNSHEFTINDCIKPLDRDNSVIALEIIENYMINGDTKELSDAKHEVTTIYSDVSDL